MSLSAAAEDEAAIHHRPTVSSEAVTDKANRINKALAQALLLCTQTSPRPLYLLFLLTVFVCFFPLLIHFFLSTSVFSRVTSFICVWLQLLSILSLSALLLGPRWTCWYTVELSALTEDEKKEKHFRKKEKTKAWGLPKAIQLVSAAAPTSDKCIHNFFRGVEWFKLWRGECSPNRQFKWWRALCSTHKPFQTAVEMLLER